MMGSTQPDSTRTNPTHDAFEEPISWQPYGPPPHGCVFHALRCDPSRCVHAYTWTHRDGSQRIKIVSVWGGVCHFHKQSFARLLLPSVRDTYDRAVAHTGFS